MRVTQARLDRYRADVDACGNAAARYVEQYIAALRDEFPDMSVEDLRDEAIGAIDDALNAFGDQASELALDLFEEIVTVYGFKPETRLESVVTREMIEGGVRYRARYLVEGLSNKFDRDVADLTRYYIHRSAFENMERNCARNDLRYARVPSGRETCGFCFMLSSRGFVYRSEQTAGGAHAYHEHCDCVIVPGFKDKGHELDVQIDGYDPDLMGEHWNECQATIGGEKELRERWKSMTKAQRARYKGNNNAERYRRFVNARTIREVEMRDFRWLNTGEIPRIDYSENPFEAYGQPERRGLYTADNFHDHNGEWRDVFAMDMLSESGFSVKTRGRNAPDGYSNIDILIGGELWEIKSPEDTASSNPEGLRFVEGNLRAAVKQFKNQYDPDSDSTLNYGGKIRVVFNSMYKSISDKKIEKELRRQIRIQDVDEILFIRKDGSIIRIEK